MRAQHRPSKILALCVGPGGISYPVIGVWKAVERRCPRRKDGLWLLGIDAPGSGAGSRADSLLWTQVSSSFLILEAFSYFPTSSAIHANRFLGSFYVLEVLDQEGGSGNAGHVVHKVSSAFSHRACFCPRSSSLLLPAVSLVTRNRGFRMAAPAPVCRRPWRRPERSKVLLSLQVTQWPLHAPPSPQPWPPESQLHPMSARGLHTGTGSLPTSLTSLGPPVAPSPCPGAWV